MPSRKNEPRKYVPREPVVAMQVAPPYSAVAEWCGGHIIRDGPRFSKIAINTPGQPPIFATPGEYIVKFGQIFIKWTRQGFESYYQEEQGK